MDSAEYELWEQRIAVGGSTAHLTVLYASLYAMPVSEARTALLQAWQAHWDRLAPGQPLPWRMR